MAINKVIDRNGNTLIDLTGDTVASNKVLSGIKFHGSDGRELIGTLEPNEVDILKYNFIDYDGTIIYSFTDAEIDAMTELPAGPNHTDENLTFQEWNWSLEDLKSWNRERMDRPIVGANYITTDGKSYFYLDTPLQGASLKLKLLEQNKLISIDWGDGTVDKNTSHTYTNPGIYIVIVDMENGGTFYFESGEGSSSTNKQYIKNIKLGNVSQILSKTFESLSSLETISIPAGLTSVKSNAFEYCYSLKSIVIPKSAGSTYELGLKYCNALEYISLPSIINSLFSYCCDECTKLKALIIPDNTYSSIPDYMFRSCRSLKLFVIPAGVTSIAERAFMNCYNVNIPYIPDSVTTLGYGAFQYCYRIENLKIPDGVTAIPGYLVRYCNNLKYIYIPDSVESIASDALNGPVSLTIDLSDQTKVITLNSSISYSTRGLKILVPSALLSSYKSASNWANYADYIVGV